MGFNWRSLQSFFLLCYCPKQLFFSLHTFTMFVTCVCSATSHYIVNSLEMFKFILKGLSEFGICITGDSRVPSVRAFRAALQSRSWIFHSIQQQLQPFTCLCAVSNTDAYFQVSGDAYSVLVPPHHFSPTQLHTPILYAILICFIGMNSSRY